MQPNARLTMRQPSDISMKAVFMAAAYRGQVRQEGVRFIAVCNLCLGCVAWIALDRAQALGDLQVSGWKNTQRWGWTCPNESLEGST